MSGLGLRSPSRSRSQSQSSLSWSAFTLLLLICITFWASGASAAEGKVDEEKQEEVLVTDTETAQKPLRPASNSQDGRYAQYLASGGHDRVHTQWLKLRETEPTWVEAVASAPPSGLSGKAWHYTKVVLKALFMNSPTRKDGGDIKIRPELQTAIEVWETGASYHDPDAIFLLAQTSFFGNFSRPRDFNEAFRRYEQLADLNGNATAQHMLGLMYATGIGGAVERDQAKALLYHTFAAEQHSIKSEMTLAFRYHAGVGTVRNCNKAAEYYKRVADKAMHWWQSGPAGGHHIQKHNVRWVEFQGGSYGEGASMSSSGPHASREGPMTPTFDDILEVLDMRERQGDWSAVLGLAKHYYEPPRGYRRNLKKAQRQFMKIARAYWKDGKVNPKAPKGIEGYAAKAAAFIGRMFLRGEGMDRNYEKAIMWFRRAIANGDGLGQYHLGLMYRDGLGLPKDGMKAATYLKAAAEQNVAAAQSALGILFLDQGDVETAHRYFELAATAGVMEAFYYLAEMTGQGIGQERNCGLSVAYYKVVAEKAELTHSSFSEANAAFERGDLDRAFIVALMAAEQGYENAQANVALLLDEKTALLSLPSVPLLANPLSPTAYHGRKRSKLLTNPALALVYYTRSAKQANTDSLIKMGDYYLSGITGEDTSHAHESAQTSEDAKVVSPDLDKASTCYTTAAESHHSAQALWNLGWMHENGIGSITQDFHMAKRYYDLALEMNKEAYLPVKLALIKLRARSWWNSITGGKINSIKKDEAAEANRPKTFMEWLSRFLDAAEEINAQGYADAMRGAGDHADDVDGLGAYGEPGMPGGDAEYYYHTRNENHQRHGNNDGARGGGIEADYLDGDFDDSGLVETLIIIALAGALAMLVYARQLRQREHDRQQEQARNGGNMNVAVAAAAAPPVPAVAPVPAAAPAAAPAPPPAGQPAAAAAAQDRGFFPQPGEAEFANWVAGGIGN